MSSNALMEAFLAKHGGKGVQSKAEREAESKAIARVEKPQAPAKAEQRDAMIVTLEAARDLVSKARTIQESKAALDIVVAAQVYAKRQELGAEIEAEGHGIRVFAEAQLGKKLAETPRAKGSRYGGTNLEPPENDPPTLKSMGISRPLSIRAQRLAKLPEDELERVAATPPKRQPRGEPKPKESVTCPQCNHEFIP